jgi:hypothetical protein
MVPMVLGAVLVLAVVGGPQAETVTVSGSLKNVDAEQNTLTLKLKDGDREFTVTKQTKIFSVLGPTQEEVKDGLRSELFKKAGTPVSIKIAKQGDKEVVTEVVIVLGKED